MVAATVSVVDDPRPLVAVRNPQIWADTQHGYVSVPEALVLDCSVCGELSDWESLSIRALLQHRAKTHAREVHAGDVDAEGWAR